MCRDDYSWKIKAAERKEKLFYATSKKKKNLLNNTKRDTCMYVTR